VTELISEAVFCSFNVCFSFCMEAPSETMNNAAHRRMSCGDRLVVQWTPWTHIIKKDRSKMAAGRAFDNIFKVFCQGGVILLKRIERRCR